MNDSTATPTVLTLDRPPELGPIFREVARDALSRRRGTNSDQPLPRTAAVVANQTIDLTHVAAYARTCGFRLDGTVPSSYPHVLGFPLTLLLLTREDMPFSPLGLVHITNAFTLHRPLGIDERIDVRADLDNLRPHPRGQQLDNTVTLSVDGEVVWESVSTYLRRGSPSARTDPEGADDPTQNRRSTLPDVSALPVTARWRLPADIGRRYAAVSGDHNPIHLSTLSARLLGFRRAIVHGMWTKAACLAALDSVLPEAFSVDVAFTKPVFLPATAEFCSEAGASADGDGGWRFGVRLPDGTPHLTGRTSGIP